ncbi:hypothetical protein KI387_039141 [Taxus chinensis]|uniref:Uncharacterized protein n=1 Tax=Taxus chinensis TaxID=29808 RepID=A0AA38FAN2_TAXCH|nr:hypothetical protein KI387_039141 [Taxus chinensis]
MGNAVGRGRVKIMKLDGEILKFKPPLTVQSVLQNYPNHVIMHSDAVRHVGVKAQPLEGSTQLKAKQLYFLLEMPRIENLRAPGRVRSEINMSAKSRLEAMLLARRTSSDIGALSSSHYVTSTSLDGENGPIRLQVRLSKAQLAQLESQSQNSSETAQKILDFYLNEAQAQQNVGYSGNLTETSGLRSSLRSYPKPERNRVRFSTSARSEEVF